MAAMDILGRVWTWGNTEHNLFNSGDIEVPIIIFGDIQLKAFDIAYILV